MYASFIRGYAYVCVLYIGGARSYNRDRMKMVENKIKQYRQLACCCLFETIKHMLFVYLCYVQWTLLDFCIRNCLGSCFGPFFAVNTHSDNSNLRKKSINLTLQTPHCQIFNLISLLFLFGFFSHSSPPSLLFIFQTRPYQQNLTKVYFHLPVGFFFFENFLRLFHLLEMHVGIPIECCRKCYAHQSHTCSEKYDKIVIWSMRIQLRIGIFNCVFLF